MPLYKHLWEKMYSYKRIKNPIQRFTDRILKVLWRYNIAERDYDIERRELVQTKDVWTRVNS